MNWKAFLVLLLGLCLVLTSGCALTYMKEKQTENGTKTERTFGLLGGLLPLWHYEGEKPPQQKQENNKQTHDAQKHEENAAQ